MVATNPSFALGLDGPVRDLAVAAPQVGAD